MQNNIFVCSGISDNCPHTHNSVSWKRCEPKIQGRSPLLPECVCVFPSMNFVTTIANQDCITQFFGKFESAQRQAERRYCARFASHSVLEPSACVCVCVLFLIRFPCMRSVTQWPIWPRHTLAPHKKEAESVLDQKPSTARAYYHKVSLCAFLACEFIYFRLNAAKLTKYFQRWRECAGTRGRGDWSNAGLYAVCVERDRLAVGSQAFRHACHHGASVQKRPKTAN